MNEYLKCQAKIAVEEPLNGGISCFCLDIKLGGYSDFLACETGKNIETEGLACQNIIFI